MGSPRGPSLSARRGLRAARSSRQNGPAGRGSAGPLYLGSAVLLVFVLELFALDGRALQHLGGFSLAPWQSAARERSAPARHGRRDDDQRRPVLRGRRRARCGRGSSESQAAAQLLFAIAPFALLHPLGYLVRTGEYSRRIDWLYAACATAIMLLSQRRQRRSFYYAGLLNLGIALYLIAPHRDWFERPAWAIAVIAAGLAALAVGFALDRAERRRKIDADH